MSLVQTQDKHQAAHKLLADGVDPGQARKDDKRAAKLASTNTFETVALAWMEEHRPQVSDSIHAHTVAWMQNDVFPWLGVNCQ